jgi:hypothetical protein
MLTSKALLVSAMFGLYVYMVYMSILNLKMETNPVSEKLYFKLKEDDK